jgi:hypothetical protein
VTFADLLVFVARVHIGQSWVVNPDRCAQPYIANASSFSTAT